MMLALIRPENWTAMRSPNRSAKKYHLHPGDAEAPPPVLGATL